MKVQDIVLRQGRTAVLLSVAAFLASTSFGRSGKTVTLPDPAEDGWYEFGNTSYTGGTPSAADGSNKNTYFYHMEYPQWDQMASPGDDIKVRLIGGVAIDPLPEGWTLDTSQAKSIVALSPKVFPAGTSVVVPKNSYLRFAYGTLTNATTGTSDYLGLTITNNAMTVGCDLAITGTVAVSSWTSKPTCTGRVEGNGLIYFYNFGVTGTFTGDWAFNGRVYGGQNGTTVTLKPRHVSGTISEWYYTGSFNDPSYIKSSTSHKSVLVYNPQPLPGETASELHINKFTVDTRYECAEGAYNFEVSRRLGYAICCFSNNTVHISTVTTNGYANDYPRALHLLADSNMNNKNRVGFGYGRFNLDTIKHPVTIYPGTNELITVGTVMKPSVFDYNCGLSNKVGAVNTGTLTFTNTVDSGTVVQAHSPALMPKRISGFAAGGLRLTSGATSSPTYGFSVDFASHPEADYVADPNLANATGCEGTGRILEMPASGTVAVTIATGATPPPPGTYPLMTCTSGADFSAWTVNMTVGGRTFGNVGDGRVVLGERTYSVRRDGTGLWLSVSASGCTIFIR